MVTTAAVTTKTSLLESGSPWSGQQPLVRGTCQRTAPRLPRDLEERASRVEQRLPLADPDVADGADHDHVGAGQHGVVPVALDVRDGAVHQRHAVPAAMPGDTAEPVIGGPGEGHRQIGLGGRQDIDRKTGRGGEHSVHVAVHIDADQDQGRA